MQRALLAIGCNSYEHLDPLDGAELDAQRLFEELTDTKVGNYDKSLSTLLLSPSIQEMKEVVEKTLYGAGKLDTFTFFFAGHGVVNPTGFYICLRDSRLDRLPTTGYWLSQLFSTLADSAPVQANVILDACCSGGLVVDLATLTKGDILGDAGSPALTLLAMAARNQEAKEEGDGGYGTNALLDSISGRLFVHDHGSSLDLYSIGLAITERFKRDLDQTPCLWALNTTQKSIFCRNPNYQATTESAFRKWDPRAFIDAIEPVLASHSREPAEMIADVQRLTGGLLDRAKGADDAFQEIEVRTTAVISLLDYCGTWTVIDKYVLDEIQTVCDLTSAAISAAAKAIEDYQYALITRKGGMSELYVLPIRISKLIGWTGALYHFYALLSQRDRFPSAVFLNLLNALIENYPLSISLMCDNQAPYLALGLTAAHQLGFREQGETLLSCLLNSAVGVRGQIADAHIPNGEILRYLLARLEGNFGEALSLVAKPSESLAVLLRAAPLFGLTDEFDHALEELDHVNLNAYFAHDYQRFAQQYIEGGENATFTIGHGIWTVGDLHAVWPFDLALPPPNSAVACGAIAASLIFPDRVPWFVFPNKEDYPAELVKSADDDVDSPTP